MENQSKIDKIENYVFELFHEDATGHDFYHMKRVAKMAKLLAEGESADPFISEAAGWLHDVGDKKLFKDPDLAIDHMKSFLRGINLTNGQITSIEIAMKDVSYSRGNKPKTLEGKVVQDADRLDAIGAIGIARTFAFGGHRGNPIYTEVEESLNKTSVQHFYDKLLLLKDLMNTNSAKTLAGTRHTVMEAFLKEFYNEWNVDSFE